MYTLRIEHAIGNYDSWKRAFDRDPARRRESGVRRHRVLRPSGDHHRVTSDLDFDALSDARALLDAMLRVWRSRQAAPALAGAVQAQILDTLEHRELHCAEAP